MRNAFFLSLLSAALLSCGWLGGSGLTLLVAFVPLLLLSRRSGSGRRAFWRMAGWVALALGLWSAVTTWWIWFAAPIGAILSVIITVGLFGGMFMLFHYVSQRAPAPLAYTLLVAGWIACEFLYTVGEVSFPWLVLGNGFANDVWAVQWYEVTGVFGGTLWVWFSNILIYSALEVRHGKAWILPAVVVIVPLSGSLVRYVAYEETGPEVGVTVVQPNIDPYGEKFVVTQQQQTGRLIALAEQAPQGVDYIVMPETAIDDRLWEGSLQLSPSLARLRQMMRERYPEAQLIVGASTYRRYGAGDRIPATARTHSSIDFYYDTYNSALAVDTSERVEIHHKSKLVVGVEKMPYYGLLRHLEFLIIDLGGITGQLATDSVQRVFYHPHRAAIRETGASEASWKRQDATEVGDAGCALQAAEALQKRTDLPGADGALLEQPGMPSGTAICYESVYGESFSEFVRNGAQVMFVITNDGWWGDTPGYRQHFSFSRLRAIESRRSIARSANTGISGLIDQRGRILQRLEWEEMGVLNGTLRANDRVTFYTRYGDYVGRLSSYIFGLCLLYFVAYRVRRRSHLVD